MWRLINSGSNSGSMNMAIDEALLGSKDPILRFYQWKPITVSLGYSQNLYSEINVEVCKSLGIDIVRRFTGGKAVLHDQELTYSFICTEDMLPKSIVESYRVISTGILNALRSLGLDATMKESDVRKINSAICFEEPSWYEILVNGKKIVGSAQKRMDGKILQHGSVLLDFDFDKQGQVFKGHNKTITTGLRDRITSINQELDNRISYAKIGCAMKKGFEENFNIDFKEDTLTQDELIKSKRLDKEKYSTKEWNELH